MASDLILRYTLHPDGAHLVQVLGDTPCPQLPDTVGGAPITQIGAYAFAAKPEKIRPDGPVLTETVGRPTAEEPLCGRALQAVGLPTTVRILQNAAFYDCRSLQELTVGPSLEALGSDIFTNCFKLATVRIVADPEQPTGLKRLLYALQNDMRVLFVPQGKTVLALRYPEFWEELEENAPAHILNMSIHGQGYMYRQCFSPDVLNLAEYDRVFHPSLAEGNHTLLGLLALDRLRWPGKLHSEAEAEYRRFLQEEGTLPAKALIRVDDTEGLTALCDLKVLDEAAVTQLTAFCSEQDKPAAQALLMDYKHRCFGRAKKTYSFDF